MNKKFSARITAGLLALVMALGLALPASAADKRLEAAYTGTKIVLDGDTILPMDATGRIVEPFAVDGTTYLPIRAVADALGLGVDWDQATKTVKLSTGRPSAPPDGSQLAAAEFCAFGETVCTLYFPSNWADAVYMENDIDNGRITFYDYANYDEEAGYGGRLFALRLFTSYSEYEHLPNRKFVQKIILDGVSYDLVLIRPSDVQFDPSPEKEQSYMSKYRQIDGIVEDMVFSSAVQFPQPVIKTITATYTGTKITLDGKAITPKDANGKTVEPFAVKGTTYLPIRAVANALGLEVGWNQATKTVTLSSKPVQSPAPASTPKPQPDPKPDPEPAPEARTVYVTPTGKRYHYDGSCNGGTYIASTLAEALSRGLTPCNKCVL